MQWHPQAGRAWVELWSGLEGCDDRCERGKKQAGFIELVGSVNILMFKNFLQNELLPGRKVSTSTVGRFLNGLGYAFTRLKKACILMDMKEKMS